MARSEAITADCGKQANGNLLQEIWFSLWFQKHGSTFIQSFRSLRYKFSFLIPIRSFSLSWEILAIHQDYS